MQERRGSVIIALRKFHNHIKRQLLLRSQEGLTPGLGSRSLLDIGCGKGGDLNKWLDAGIGCVLGLDISLVSLEEARGRARRLRTRELGERQSDWVTFAELDPFVTDINTLTSKVPVPLGDFRTVSCQFTLHYAFGKEETARRLLWNVAQQLRPGGLFVGTFADGDSILRHVRREDQPPNRICRVTANFDPAAPAEFGSQYIFQMEDAIDSCPEYLTRPHVLTRLAEEAGLKAVEIKPFRRWLKEYKGHRLSQEEEEASCLYSSFVFQRA